MRNFLGGGEEACSQAILCTLFAAWMLRSRGLCGLEAKLFGLSLMASGLGFVEIDLVISKVYSIHDINGNNGQKSR